MPASILIVDDEKNTREGLRQALEDEYDVYLASDAEQAFQLMKENEFDVVLTDLKMAGASGLKVIDFSLSLPRRPVVIMMTAYGSVETAVEAMRRGAYDFMTKPVNLEKLELLVQRSLRGRKIETENRELKSQLQKNYSFEAIIGHSRAIQEVIEKVRLIAPSRASVMITGETGTGKELVAQAIHHNSPRASGTFVAVHCAALSSSLLESELFGYEKGAFTGATERRMGRFEAADGGTLFLDEIGEIDASTQVKLLRFLESRTFERLGSVKPIQVDVRLVCATNRDLEQMVRQEKFREDLYFRLNVVTLRLPALRERKDDIPLLLHHFLKKFAEENGTRPTELSPEVLPILQEYSWPGNIRELRNFCENVTVLFPGRRLSQYDLDVKYLHPAPALPPIARVSPAPPTMEENEKRLIRNALQQTSGNRTRAAEILGISRRTLIRKLKQWPELDQPDAPRPDGAVAPLLEPPRTSLQQPGQ